jgi:hypothetical protein
MRWIETVALSVFLCLVVASSALADVHVSMRDGRVSISAQNATVGEILAEWSKIGQIKVLNLEVLPSDRISIELKDVSEEQALDVVLRAVSGYVAARRQIVVADISRFDRILIMPPSVAPPPVANERSVASAIPAPTDQVPEYQAPADPVPAYKAPAGQTVEGTHASARSQRFTRQQPAGDVGGVHEGQLPAPPVNDEAQSPVQVAAPPLDPPGQVPVQARQPLEVIDPRQYPFQMPTAVARPAVATRPTPGKIVPPPRRDPGVQ